MVQVGSVSAPPGAAVGTPARPAFAPFAVKDTQMVRGDIIADTGPPETARPVEPISSAEGTALRAGPPLLTADPDPLTGPPPSFDHTPLDRVRESLKRPPEPGAAEAEQRAAAIGERGRDREDQPSRRAAYTPEISGKPGGLNVLR